MYATYLTWHKGDLHHSFSLSTDDTLVWLNNIITWGSGFDLIDYVPCLGGILDLEIRNQLLSNVCLSIIDFELYFSGRNQSHKL